MTLQRFILTSAANLLLASLATSEAPTLAERLERLAETLEAARVDAHVPGMSIAVVRGDEIVWARGFGLADLEADTPADEHTLYAIGSTTKAFTAVLAGMVADDGALDFDDPVTRHLPEFDLETRGEHAASPVTLRDLLCHRSGFGRMSILWVGGNSSRAEILQTAVGAEPLDDLRAGFHYSNVMYLAAGEATAAAAGRGWDELMTERLLEPLGMQDATLDARTALEDPRLARGYRWMKSRREHEAQEMVELHPIAPAGSINAHVVDMAQWVRFQLGRGELEGRRLLSAEHHAETWEAQIAMGGGASYGLGWMLREHDGHRVVEHGGNIGGFSAEVALVPDEDLGFVLLMNLAVSPLQQTSIPLVLDGLLGEWPEEASASAHVREAGASATEVEPVLEEYVGTYVANFATFRDEAFVVAIDDDHLTLDIPSQRVFALRSPDADGLWGFVLTDQISISFERGTDGAVEGLVVHQGGYRFQVPREGRVVAPDAPVEELETLVGTYERAGGGKQIRLFLREGHLTVENRGQWVPLCAPDADDRAAIRGRPEHGVTFTRDAEGRAESLIFHGDAGDRPFVRVEEDAPEDLPTLADLRVLRDVEARSAALESGGVRSTGELWMPNAGVRGRVTSSALGNDRHAEHLDFGRFGHADVVVRDGEAWTFNPLVGFQVLEGEELTQALLGHPSAVHGDWSAHFDRIEVLRNESLAPSADGGEKRATHVVRLRKDGAPSRTYWVDAETGDVLQVKLTLIESGVRIPSTLRFGDFREVGGVRRAHRIRIENPASGAMVLTLESFETGLTFGPEEFALEDPAAVPVGAR